MVHGIAVTSEILPYDVDFSLRRDVSRVSALALQQGCTVDRQGQPFADTAWLVCSGMHRCTAQDQKSRSWFHCARGCPEASLPRRPCAVGSLARWMHRFDTRVPSGASKFFLARGCIGLRSSVIEVNEGSPARGDAPPHAGMHRTPPIPSDPLISSLGGRMHRSGELFSSSKARVEMHRMFLVGR
jgi:hypothetical protein